MRVTREETFHPVKIELHSQMEVDVLYGILQYGPLHDCFKNSRMDKEYDFMGRLLDAMEGMQSDDYDQYFDAVTSFLIRKKDQED